MLPCLSTASRIGLAAFIISNLVCLSFLSNDDSTGLELICISALQGVSKASIVNCSLMASSGIITAASPNISTIYGATKVSDAVMATFILTYLDYFLNNKRISVRCIDSTNEQLSHYLVSRMCKEPVIGLWINYPI